MADSKKLRSKIQSTINIKKITNALEIFSTIKLQKTKKNAIHIREGMLALINLLIGINKDEWLFEQKELPKTNKTLLIVLWSDKWLCWSLNTMLFKKILATFDTKKDQVDLFVVWKKAKDFFSRRNYSIVGETFLWDDVSLDNCKDVLAYTEDSIQKNTYKKIFVCYSVFKNTMKYIPVIFPLFPLHSEKLHSFLEELQEEKLWHMWYFWHEANNWQDDTGVIITTETKMEPSKAVVREVIRSMIMSYIVYGALLQNKTSEFAARMLAMKWAKDNASSQIDDLTLAYNKARQDAITKEIIEIAGAKAIVLW